ncbi:MAG: lipoprotein-releasing ABC transporter permease subunit [Pseudomonadota bacterium]|nr:lipoprotein-releasing ABC transporter permease subunit [Pseudomonadota bacterium]
MISKTELFIGMRYLSSKRRNGFVSFITAVSLLGVALGVSSLIIILSVMNGFEYELRDRLLSMSAHGYITNTEESIKNWEPVYQKLINDDDVISVSPVLAFEGMLRNGRDNQGVKVNAIFPDYENKTFENKVNFLVGDLSVLKPGSNAVLLGRNLAMMLNVKLNDNLILLVPIANDGVIEPVLGRFNVQGFFEAGIHEHDSMLALVNIKDAQKLISNDSISFLRFTTKDPMLAPIISDRLSNDLGDNYFSVDWAEENSAYFGAIKLEKMMMSLMLALVIGVAAFNIIASLTMVVTEKKGDIAVLRTLGMSTKGIKSIFFLQGILIGLTGVVLGVLMGCLVAINVPEWVPILERFFGFQIMPGDVFYVTAIPSVLLLRDVFLVALTACMVTSFATSYPAKRATHVDPAIALRYE